MATPPSMAKEPAASEATPLVATLEVELLVALGVVVVETRVVMVVWAPVAVVDRLPWTEDETTEDEAAEEAALVEVAEALVDDEPLVELAAPVSDALEDAEPELVLAAAPPVILKGKPYWKTVASDSRVMMIP